MKSSSMRRGPKPKPQTLDEMASHHQNLGPLIKPDWMPKGAALVWDEQAPLARGVKSADSAAFADFCVCLYRLRGLERTIETEGLVVSGASGARKNPACQLAREYRLAVQRWAPEFGMTPAAGTKIKIGATDAKDGTVSGSAHERPNLLSGQWLPSEVKQ